jgi:hypothetical protein
MPKRGPRGDERSVLRVLRGPEIDQPRIIRESLTRVRSLRHTDGSNRKYRPRRTQKAVP